MYVTFMTFVKGFRGIITIKKDLQCTHIQIKGKRILKIKQILI